MTSRARTVAAVLAGRGARVVIRALRGGRGGGTAVPGGITNRIAPNLLAEVVNAFPEGVIAVSGSSGKSTTTRMLVALLRAHGLSVFTNDSTANIRQGLTSNLLQEITITGRPRSRIAVLEFDEAHGARLVEHFTPTTVVLTNVMTDQIDRFPDPLGVAHMLATIAQRATERVVLNADDAYVDGIASSLLGVEVTRFGVSDAVLAAQPHGLGYLRTSPSRLDGGTVLQKVSASKATVLHGTTPIEIDLPARGVHYAIDAAAAIAAASVTLGDSFDPALTAQTLSNLVPLFGRGEVVVIGGKKVELVLVQNPASFQLNIDELPGELEQVLVAVGSDVHDPSYLWPVDTAPLRKVVGVTGSLAEAMALQLLYRGVSVGSVEPDLGTALDAFVALPEPSAGVKTIIFSADSMRRTLRHWKLA